MHRLALPALALLSAPLLLAFVTQTRAKTNEPQDFGALLTTAKADWDAGRFGGCLNSLNGALALASEKRIEVIRKALPEALEGWEAVPDKKQPNVGTIPGMAALAAVGGNVAERRWSEIDGRGSVTVSVTADSPMVSMVNAFLTNPAMLGEGKELIEYGTHKAILETRDEGMTHNLQIIIAGKHMCEVRARGLAEKGLFAMFDQAAVDRLAGVLAD